MAKSLLIIKTGALGDVLRTTSILPGLAARYPGARVVWVTAPGAAPLVAGHPLVDEVLTWDGENQEDFDALVGRLAPGPWTRILSFDDEFGPCRLAAQIQRASSAPLSGAWEDESGALVYSDDVEPWFGMGLLSRAGKQEADRRKIANQRSHAEIFASMLGIEGGRPELVLDAAVRDRAQEVLEAGGPLPAGPLIGLNTGAGGRWTSKGLDAERTVEVARHMHEALGGEGTFLVLGGLLEAGLCATILEGLGRIDGLRAVDGGTGNSLLEFAALIECCELLVCSDSLALHMGVALRRPVVAFFAPTSGAEIELFGLGRKVCSTTPDYCSYLPDADNCSITPERLCSAAMEILRR